MTAPEPVVLTDGERVGAMEPCDHYYAWVSPAGAGGSARICMTCHSPDPEWLNRLDAERAAHEALREAVEGLADRWAGYGEGSEAWRVFGPQVLSVPFAVDELRAALAAAVPTPPESAAEGGGL